MPGQSHDLDGADVLLKNMPGQTVIADKVYVPKREMSSPCWTKTKGS